MAGVAHEFALYYPDLPTKQTANYALKAEELMHRIKQVLRLVAEDELVLFNAECHATFKITAITKKEILGLLGKPVCNAQFSPHITVYLPILKRVALEEALYAAVELGAQAIQLISTQKTPPLGNKQELERLNRIIIAAAEQSKNFAVPKLYAPVPLAHALAQANNKAAKVYADATGTPLLEIMQQITTKKPADLIFMVGPAGDLIEEEKLAVITAGFALCALTPTVLRSQQALALGLGALRALQ